jgi:large subunit ribosomal protein L30
MLTITLNKGLAGKKASQTKVAAALGLSKYGSSVTRADSPTIRGMINKVQHLVTVTTDNKAPEKKIVKAKKEEVSPKAKAAKTK